MHSLAVYFGLPCECNMQISHKAELLGRCWPTAVIVCACYEVLAGTDL